MKAPCAARVWIARDPKDVARLAAGEVALRAREAIEARGRFTIVLAGGATPRSLYRRLASFRTSPATPFPWDRTHFFWSDERSVPSDHADSNFRMAWESLLGPAAVRAENVHRIVAGERSAEAAAEAYEREIRRFFDPPDERPPPFDLVLLGIGSDGHTASLFPGSPALLQTDQWVAAPWVPQLGSSRITMTLPLLNQARSVLFLVCGASKAEAVRQTLECPASHPSRPPAARVRPPSGGLTYVLDDSAAGHLGARPVGELPLRFEHPLG